MTHPTPDDLRQGRAFADAVSGLADDYLANGHGPNSAIIRYLREVQEQVAAYLADPADPQMQAEMANVMVRFNETAAAAIRGSL